MMLKLWEIIVEVVLEVVEYYKKELTVAEKAEKINAN